MKAYGIKPEVEAFDLSMIFQAAALQRTARSTAPLHVQFVMGVKNAMPVDREVLRVLRQDARAPLARRDLDRRRHRPRPGDPRTLVARARRPLPHRPRGQRPPRQGRRSRRRTPRWSRRSPGCARNTAGSPRPRPRRGACSALAPVADIRCPPRAAAARPRRARRARRGRRSLAGGPRRRRCRRLLSRTAEVRADQDVVDARE